MRGENHNVLLKATGQQKEKAASQLWVLMDARAQPPSQQPQGQKLLSSTGGEALQDQKAQLLHQTEPRL